MYIIGIIIRNKQTRVYELFMPTKCPIQYITICQEYLYSIICEMVNTNKMSYVHL